MTLQPTKRAPWSAIALMVRSSLARDDEKPGTIGAISTPALMPASTSSRTARSRCSGWRGAGLERLPGLLVDGRDAHVDGARRARRRLREHVAVAHDHRTFGDEPDRGCARASERLRWRRASACSALRSAGSSRSRCRRRRTRRVHDGRASSRVSTSTKFCFTRITDANSSSAFISNCDVIAARVAVVAAVRAAAVGVERPVERHALHAVQRRTAGDFLIARLVGAPLGLGQRVAAAGLDGVRDVACRGFGGAEIEEQRKGGHGLNRGETIASSLLFRRAVKPKAPRADGREPMAGADS